MDSHRHNRNPWSLLEWESSCLHSVNFYYGARFYSFIYLSYCVTPGRLLYLSCIFVSSSENSSILYRLVMIGWNNMCRVLSIVLVHCQSLINWGYLSDWMLVKGLRTVPDPGNEELMNKTDCKEFANLITQQQQIQKGEEKVLQRLIVEWCLCRVYLEEIRQISKRSRLLLFKQIKWPPSRLYIAFGARSISGEVGSSFLETNHLEIVSCTF